MRITTSMVQRNVLSDLNSLSESSPGRSPRRPRARRSRARPTIRSTPRARWACARRSAANEQYTRNIEDAQGWQDSTESALDSITDYVNRAHDLLLQGATDTADAGVAQARSPPRSTRSSRASRKRRTPATATTT